jgi:soluble lytic murein transglycosylase-like protein
VDADKIRRNTRWEPVRWNSNSAGCNSPVKDSSGIRHRPKSSGWSVSALACLGLGLSSFAEPVAERFSPSDATESHVAAQEVALATPPRRSCSSDAIRALDRDAVANAVAYFHARRSNLTETEIQQVAEVLVDCAAHYAIDPKLVIAVIHVESRGNPFAVSPVGAMGLMQIMPPTGEELAAELGVQWIGSRLLFEPEINVRFGVAYLRQLRQRFGDWPTALTAYNWGPNKISRRLRAGAALPVVYSSSVLEAKRNRT